MKLREFARFHIEKYEHIRGNQNFNVIFESNFLVITDEIDKLDKQSYTELHLKHAAIHDNYLPLYT